MRWLYYTAFCILYLLLPGCQAGLQDTQATGRSEVAGEASAAAKALLDKDPGGPIPAPRLPEDLSAGASAPAQERESGKVLPYMVECESPEDPALAKEFMKTSLLARLAGSPPESVTSLERRLDTALEEGRNILRSKGYYAGAVTGRVEFAGTQAGADAGERDSSGKASGTMKESAVVRVLFTPGPRYVLGRSAVIVTDADAAPHSAPEQGKPPATLSDVGLAPGAPAEADAVLDAVDRVRDAFRNNGYPFAEIASTRYTLDNAARSLEVDVRVKTGAFSRLGEVRIHGESSVKQAYLASMRTWKPGQPWSEKSVGEFREKLRASGLFSSIEISPAKTADSEGRRDVEARLEAAPERTVSGSLNYDSDFGPGVQGEWEHRNLTGLGDSLRLSLPMWLDMQEFTAAYRLPFFLRKDQTFIARGGLLNQNTDAYDLQSAAAAAGVERRFSPFWSGSLMASAEGGRIKDPDEPRREYAMLGLPLGLAYDNTGSILNATRGIRLIGSAGPYSGMYDGSFTVLRGRLDAHAFVPLLGQDSLILALRGAYGTLWGATAQEVPPSVRFYSGGGGSVRGYDYQSLGPRNDDNDPLGGASLLELSGEVRWKITPEWGMAAFLDGGMAYSDAISALWRDLRWGAGLGLRYYTAIGPLRLDVATPITPRKDDAPLQFYISIGQSF